MKTLYLFKLVNRSPINADILNMLRALTILCLLAFASAATASPFGISYSGRLTSAAGKPVAGPVDIDLKFFDASAAGNQRGSTIPFTNITLVNGLFTIELPLDLDDLHPIFGTGETWVEVKDVTNAKTYPRQRFLAVPYALKVPVDDETITFGPDGKLAFKVPPVANRVLGADGAGALTWINLAGSGLGDMLAGTWDSDSNAKVDAADVADLATLATSATNATQLGGQAASYYTNASNITTGTLATAQVPNLDTAKVTTGTFAPARIATDANNRFVSDAEKTTWNTAAGWGNHAAAGYLTSAPVTTVNGQSGAVSLDASHIPPTATRLWLSDTDKTKLNGIEALADVTDAANVAAAGAVMDGDYTANGILARNGAAGTYTMVTNNSANWDTAYGWGNHASAGYLGAGSLASPGAIGGTTPAAGTFTTLQANTSVKLRDGDTNTVTMQAPSLSADYTLTMPNSAGASGQVMTTNGSGVLSWDAASRTSAVMSFYVNGSTGNDTNNCTGAGTACLTIQAAINKIPKNIFHDVTVDIATGTYNETVEIAGFNVAYGITLLIRGSGGVATINGQSTRRVGVSVANSSGAGPVYLEKLTATAHTDYGFHLMNSHVYLRDVVATSNVVAGIALHRSSVYQGAGAVSATGNGTGVNLVNGSYFSSLGDITSHTNSVFGGFVGYGSRMYINGPNINFGTGANTNTNASLYVDVNSSAQIGGTAGSYATFKSSTDRGVVAVSNSLFVGTYITANNNAGIGIACIYNSVCELKNVNATSNGAEGIAAYVGSRMTVQPGTIAANNNGASGITIATDSIIVAGSGTTVTTTGNTAYGIYLWQGSGTLDGVTTSSGNTSHEYMLANQSNLMVNGLCTACAGTTSVIRQSRLLHTAASPLPSVTPDGSSTNTTY